jgi:CrcB protein
MTRRSAVVQTRSNELGRRARLLRTILIIALGAALGANLRYFLTLRTAAWLGTGFPYGTLIINISGSFLIGLVYTLLANSGSPYTPELRLFLGVGLLGGYTTFSSFSYETYQLFLTGSTLLGLLNPLISVAGGLLASALGIVLGSLVSGRG